MVKKTKENKLNEFFKKNKNFIIVLGIFLFLGVVSVFADTFANDKLISIPNVNTSSINSIIYVQQGNASDLLSKITNAVDGNYIVVPPGNYLLTTQLKINNSITLDGGGQAILSRTSEGQEVFIDQTKSVVLKGFIINHTFANSTAVLVYNTNYSILSGLTIYGTDLDPHPEVRGIHLRNSVGNLVTQNTISGHNWDSGIRVDNLNSGSRGQVDNQGNIISNNQIYGVGNDPQLADSAASGHCMENEAISIINKTQYNIYSNNHCSNAQGYGIRVIECQSCSVTGNTIDHTNKTGIWLQNNNYTSVSGNSIAYVYASNKLHDGIELSGSSSYNSVTGNTVIHGNQCGLYIHSGNNYNTFTGNVFLDFANKSICNDAPNGNNSFVNNLEGENNYSKAYNIYGVTDTNGTLIPPNVVVNYSLSLPIGNLIFSSNLDNNSIRNFTVLDGSGNNNYANISSLANVTLSSDSYYPGSQSVYINGTGITLNNSLIGNPLSVSNSWTVALWFKIINDSGSSKTIFANSLSSTDRMAIQYDSGLLKAISNNGIVTATFNISSSLNSWHHIVFVHNATDNYAYLDGATPPATSSTTGTLSSNVGTRIGSRSDGTLPFDGNIANINIWSRDLSPTESFTLYRQSLYSKNACLFQRDIFVDRTGVVFFPASNYSGSGNAYACFRADGSMYRGNSTNCA